MLSYSERGDLAAEVAAAACEVARGVGAQGVAVELDAVSPELKTEGRTILAKAPSALEGDPDSAADAIVQVAKARGFSALLVGDTRFGALVAAKVAARLRAGSLGKGKRLAVEGERLSLERDVYGGRFAARVASRLPCVALVQAGAYRPSGDQPPAPENQDVAPAPPRVRVVETLKSDAGAGSLESASIIVAAGRGFARKEDLRIAEDLAGALGAALGCSRPLSSDLGWLGEDAHVGLTGVYVHPRLYVAVGISGQLQHVAGIRDSKVIVAINKDAQAPIFRVADYGVVGDLYSVVPALTRAVRRLKGNG